MPLPASTRANVAWEAIATGGPSSCKEIVLPPRSFCKRPYHTASGLCRVMSCGRARAAGPDVGRRMVTQRCHSRLPHRRTPPRASNTTMATRETVWMAGRQSLATWAGMSGTNEPLRRVPSRETRLRSRPCSSTPAGQASASARSYGSTSRTDPPSCPLAFLRLDGQAGRSGLRGQESGMVRATVSRPPDMVGFKTETWPCRVAAGAALQPESQPLEVEALARQPQPSRREVHPAVRRAQRIGQRGNLDVLRDLRERPVDPHRQGTRVIAGHRWGSVALLEELRTQVAVLDDGSRSRSAFVAATMLTATRCGVASPSG